MMSDLNKFCQTLSDLVQASLFELNFGNKFSNVLNFIEIVWYFLIKEFVVR